MTLNTPLPPALAAAHALERARIAELRLAIARQIQADLGTLERLEGRVPARSPAPEQCLFAAFQGGPAA